MRAVVQRVTHAQVSVDGEVVGRIDAGLLVYVGIGANDNADNARRLADKIAGLRIFDDDNGKLNLSVLQTTAQVLAIPNFTLWGDARKGRRPAFIAAAGPDVAQPLYDTFVEALRDLGCRTATGRFRTHMIISSDADGPVNIILEMPPPP